MQCQALQRAARKPGRERECGRWRVGKRGEYFSVWRAREKREPLVVCLHVNVVPRLIDHNYVLVCKCVCACVSKWVSTLKYLAPPFCNLNETIMSIMY